MQSTTHNSFYLSSLSGALVSVRMLIGAIHSLYLLNSGVSLANLASLQIVFSVTVLFLEVPTGLISDFFGRKGNILAACAALALFYGCSLFAPNMVVLSLGEFFYGLGLSMVSGTLVSWLVDTVRREFPNEPGKMAHYGFLSSETAALGSVVAGIIGAVLFRYWGGSGSVVYLVALGSMLVLLGLFAMIPDVPAAHKAKAVRTYLREVKDTVSVVVASRVGMIYLLLCSLVAAACQPIFHYWQPYFIQIINRSPALAPWSHDQSLLLGAVFAIYCLFRYVFNRVVRKVLLSRFAVLPLLECVSLLAALACAGFFLCGTDSLFTSLVLFCTVQGCLCLIMTGSQNEFVKHLETSSMASTLSVYQMLGRVTGIGMLGLIALVVNDHNMGIIFAAVSLFFLSCALVFRHWRTVERKDSELYSTITSLGEMS
ncbi:MAG: MFS transporter [Planctomycetota bacterium]|nr:MFS transporter [Planctomycetota bacterium]